MLKDFTFIEQRELTQHVSLAKTSQGLSYLVIKNDAAEGLVSLFGAHVLHYQAKNHEPLLWVSHTTAQDGVKPFRGGIPLCWPWFGPASEEIGSGKPSHGFARITEWQLDSIDDQAACTQLHLSLHSSEQTKAYWSYDFDLELTVTIGQTLELALTTHNTDQKPLTYRSALHSYFYTKDTKDVCIRGLGSHYLDKVAKQEKEQIGDFQLTQWVDSIYTQPEARVQFTTGFDTVQLNNAGDNSVVVWNPWADNAAKTDDFDSDRWQNMVCVETALTGEGTTVKPGKSHTLSVVMSYLQK